MVLRLQHLQWLQTAHRWEEPQRRCYIHPSVCKALSHYLHFASLSFCYVAKPSVLSLSIFHPQFLVLASDMAIFLSLEWGETSSTLASSLRTPHFSCHVQAAWSPWLWVTCSGNTTSGSSAWAPSGHRWSLVEFQLPRQIRDLQAQYFIKCYQDIRELVKVYQSMRYIRAACRHLRPQESQPFGSESRLGAAIIIRNPLPSAIKISTA